MSGICGRSPRGFLPDRQTACMRMRQLRVDDIPAGVDPRRVPALMDAPFAAMLRGLESAWTGKPEDEVRGALVARLAQIGQPLSEPEIELLTLQIVDPHWAVSDPERLRRILDRLRKAASASSDPCED